MKKIERRGVGVVICLERGADCSHMVELMPLPSPTPPHHLLPHLNLDWFTFLVPAYPGCPGKEAVKRVQCRFWRKNAFDLEDCPVAIMHHAGQLRKKPSDQTANAGDANTNRLTAQLADNRSAGCSIPACTGVLCVCELSSAEGQGFSSWYRRGA